MEFPNQFTHKKMVGIIPLDGFRNNWNLPYAPFFSQIGEGITLIDNAVLQCAFAGCRQIFILCKEQDVKLLKKTFGEWVEDPNWWWREVTKTPESFRVQIPIYYIRMSEKDKRQRGSAAWAIISAAKTANRLASFASKWTAATRFFVTFPWTGVPFWDFKEHRAVTGRNKKFFFSYEGKSAWEGEYLPFSFEQEDLRKLKSNFMKKNTLNNRAIADYDPNTSSWFERLPLEQQRSGRFFTIEQLLEPINKNKYVDLEMKRYYNVFTWHGLRQAISNLDDLRRPKSRYIKTGKESRILQRIGVQESE